MWEERTGMWDDATTAVDVAFADGHEETLKSRGELEALVKKAEEWRAGVK